MIARQVKRASIATASTRVNKFNADRMPCVDRNITIGHDAIAWTAIEAIH